MRFMALAISATLIAAASAAESLTVAQTYAIVEPDAYAEIQSRAAAVDWAEARNKIRMPAMQGLALPAATEDRIRQVVPAYTLPFDIRDSAGQVIYPRGFRFNPLDYLTLPYRLLVIDELSLDWAITVLQPTDMVIVAGGDIEQAAAVLERPAFVLDEKTRARLEIEVTPSIIEQQGNVLVIQEVGIRP